MKRTVFFLLFLTAIFYTIAQGPGIVQPSIGISYRSYETVVRNYNSDYNIVMDYGEDPGGVNPPHIITYSSFYIQKTNTGTLTHLFRLPFGYNVHDVRFVTLRRKSDTTQSVDFCCFCGTRYTYVGEAYGYTIGNEPGYVYTIIDSTGFAGFFAMPDAIAADIDPSAPTSATAKVRDVEGMASLYRMTCYAEGYCYYLNGSAFWDNAVLDMIGIEDTVGVHPCFVRAKFYPDYNDTILWDNNLRYNTSSNEILCDVTGTNNYTVTVSRYKNNNHDVITRHSIKETWRYLGGRQLNSTIKHMDWDALTICGDKTDDSYSIVFNDSLRLCNIFENRYAIALNVTSLNLGGILTYKFDILNNGNESSCAEGAYEKTDDTRLRELIYLPHNKFTATLVSNDNQSYSTTRINTWNVGECSIPVNTITTLNKYHQSATPYFNNNTESLLWGLTSTVSQEPFFLMNYEMPTNGYSNDDCAQKDKDNALPSEIGNNGSSLPLQITMRLPYDSHKYPVSFLGFAPYRLSLEQNCIGNN